MDIFGTDQLLVAMVVVQRRWLSLYLTRPSHRAWVLSVIFHALPPSYEGCFRDTWYGLGLANMPMDEFGETSHDSCKQHCDSADYAYYALEFGFGCSCGNELPEESTKVPDDACNLVRKEKIIR